MDGQSELVGPLGQQCRDSVNSIGPALETTQRSNTGHTSLKRPFDDIQGTGSAQKSPRFRKSAERGANGEPQEDPEDLDVRSSHHGENIYFSSCASDSDFTNLENGSIKDDEILVPRFGKAHSEGPEIAPNPANRKRPATASTSSVRRGGDFSMLKQDASRINAFPTLSDMPRSWDQANIADRILVNMKTDGRSWLQICQVWRQQTGLDAVPSSLYSRYEGLVKLRDQMQCLERGDDARLVAAVEEVQAKFRREKWQLVTEAMSRAGAASYSESVLREQYKQLVRRSRKSIAGRSLTGKFNKPPANKDAAPGRLTECMTTKSSVEQAGGQQTAGLDKGTQCDDDTSTVPVHSNAESVVYKLIKRSSDAMQNVGITQSQTPDPHIKIVGSDVKQGSVPSNAILLDDSDAEPRTFSKSSANVETNADPNASHLALGVAAPDAQKAARLSITAPRTDESPFVPSRVGSATNRGPARFASRHKAKGDNSLRQSKNASPAGFNGDFQGFGMLLPNPEEHSSHHSPYQKLAGLGTDMAQNPPIAQSLHPSQQLQPQATSPYGLPSDVGHTQKSPEYQSQAETQIPQQIGPSEQQTHANPTEVAPDIKLRTLPIAKNKSAKGKSPGRPRKSVTKHQLRDMIRHRTLNEANRSKPWDLVAQDCGVTASLTEISAALEEAGYPSILPTSVPILPPNETTYQSPYNPTPPMETPVPNLSAAATVNPATPTSTSENNNSVETSQLEETPRTRPKRGRPPKTMSQTPDHSTTSTPQDNSSSRKYAHPGQSAAMKAAWARRKELGTNGHRGGPPKSKAAGVSNSPPASSVSNFAAQILAAAALRADPTPTPAPQHIDAKPIGGPTESQENEPVDLLTGERMFAQHYEDPSPIPTDGQPPPKKIRGPYKKKPKEPKRSKNYTSRYTCDMCNKVYNQRDGLKYHRIHHPNCGDEPPKPDIRTDPPNRPDLKRVSGSKRHGLRTEPDFNPPVAQMEGDEMSAKDVLQLA